MADSKITALTSISTSSDPANDPLVIVDVSDTSMAATGTTKKVTLNQLLACSPTATLASATITGDLTVDSSTLKVDSANNRVGIGTALPAYTLDVAGEVRANNLFRTTDGTNIGIFGTNVLSAGVIGLTSGSNVPLVFGTNSTERLRIDVSGNLGLGVTPSAWNTDYRAFQLKGGGAISNNGSNVDLQISQNSYFDSATQNKYIATAAASKYTQNSGAHLWYNAASGTAGNNITFTQAMTLDASGNLLVGTTTNTDTYRCNFQFGGDSRNGLIVKNLASTGGPILLFLNDSAQSLNNATSSAEYQDSAALRWRFTKNGGLSNYQANNVNLSDERTKTDIKPLASYWNKIKALEVVTFKYKDQTHNDNNIGLIAQQVEAVAPELIDVDGFGNTPADGVPLKTIYTTDLYHGAIKALQEAMTRIEALEAKLA